MTCRRMSYGVSGISDVTVVGGASVVLFVLPVHAHEDTFRPGADMLQAHGIDSTSPRHAPCRCFLHGFLYALGPLARECPSVGAYPAPACVDDPPARLHPVPFTFYRLSCKTWCIPGSLLQYNPSPYLRGMKVML
jgi:hypothetical protein